MIQIFPEGSTSNGTHLQPFKRGAFQGEMAVMPHIMDYYKHDIRMTYEVIPLQEILMCMLMVNNKSVTIKVMPPFIPNDYLFETHKDKGTERWEVFAWAVRDAMCKEGNFKKSELRIRDRLQYMEDLGVLKRWS